MVQYAVQSSKVIMKKKLIEVALPLEAINSASIHEKSIRNGHPFNIHLWWSRKPLATCRAVLFASLVDDPSSDPDKFPTEKEQELERQRLFSIIERLVLWENSNNPDVLREARAEIMKSTNGHPPPFLDPFCGGGSIPLEAQRLGLEAHGTDLNPVAVVITKTLTEIPQKFAGLPPINPEARRRGAQSGTWTGITGLADDVLYYGNYVRDEAEKRIGYMYPKVALPKEHGGGLAPVIAWIWARAVKCPNPACGISLPLANKFWLSTKAGKKAWIEPVVDSSLNKVNFEVRNGNGMAPEGTVNRQGAICLRCSTPVSFEYIRAEGRAKRITPQLMAIASQGRVGRLYTSPTEEHEALATQSYTSWVPDTSLPEQALGFRVQRYGMTHHADLFTQRQLIALSVFMEIIGELRTEILSDISASGMHDTSYADAIITYLSLVIDKQADLGNALNCWEPVAQCPRQLFGRQAISMIWEYAEGNPLGTSSGSWSVLLDNLCRGLRSQPMNFDSAAPAFIAQKDAATSIQEVFQPIISTDPPYYDNVSYADLADFFYVWLRHGLLYLYPDLFSTLLAPKVQEMVADPFRFGGKEHSRRLFEEGMRQAFTQMRAAMNPNFPLTIYYAFKQTEDDDDGTEESVSSAVASTGWETMLQGLVNAGMQVTGTWPMRTENASRMRGQNSNALASSIVLVCRPRANEAPTATRREFVTTLRRELEDALLKMMHGNIAPVDLAQATIGPGMAVYSRYAEVIETNGTPLRVRTALQIINQELDAILSSSEGDYDGDTRFCLAWFEQFGVADGAFGQADVMARAKNTSVAGLASSGVLSSGGGKVRLLKREEYPTEWKPDTDTRKPIWECTQQLVHALTGQGGGEEKAARLCAGLGSMAEPARDLAYRLYSICERKGWAAEALAYNSLVISWPEITQLASNPNILGGSPQTAMRLED